MSFNSDRFRTASSEILFFSFLLWFIKY